MRGRPPKPTVLKVLDGDREDRINRAEPLLPPAATDPPDRWSIERDGEAFALEHWEELAPLLADVGLLTQGDRPALAFLCELYALIRLDPLDMKARGLYRNMLGEFGLTPSSRARVRSADKPPVDPLAAFMADSA